MTTITSKSLTSYLTTHSFTQITNTTALIAIVFLIVVIIEREIVRMSAPQLAKRNVVAFGIVAIPMVLIFAGVILLRFLRLSTT